MGTKLKVTDDLLLSIENAVAAGAGSDDEIAAAIGWNPHSFHNVHYGKRKEGKKERAQIDTAIEKGKKRQRRTFLQLAEYAMVKKLSGYSYTEKTVEKDKAGNIKFEKTVNKLVPPDTAAVIFTLVNCGDGKWKNLQRASDVTVKIKQDEKHIIGWEDLEDGQDEVEV